MGSSWTGALLAYENFEVLIIILAKYTLYQMLNNPGLLVLKEFQEMKNAAKEVCLYSSLAIFLDQVFTKK